MSVLPIDLQVTFTKANEYNENIAKQQNIIQSGQTQNIEKIHQQSIEVNNKVNNLEEYSDQFTRINNEENKKQSSKDNNSNLNKKSLKNGKILYSDEKNENHKGLDEEGVGRIIDIIE